MEESFVGLDVADNESVCPSCHLVFLTASGVNGICRTCKEESRG